MSTEDAANRPARSELLTVLFGYFLACTLLLWTTLDSPPYVEQAAGLWTEASWLLDHGYDYYRLRYSEPHVEDGGPRTYLTSILPTIVAGMMVVLPSPEATFAMYRLLSLLSAAVIATVCYELLTRSLPRPLSLLLLASMSLVPLYAVQLEMIGLDIPSIALASLWWRAKGQHHERFALGMAMVAFLFKPSTFILPAASVGYELVKMGFTLFARQPIAWRRHFAIGGVNFLLMGVELWILSRGGNLHGRVLPFSDLGIWAKSSPDVIVIVLLLTISMLAELGQALLRHFRRDPTSREPSPLLVWVDRSVMKITGTGVVLATCASAAMTYYESRHITIVVPLALTTLAVSLASLRIRPRTILLLTAILLGVSIVNRDGYLYPSLGDVGRGWGLPERSLEYRKDHDSNRAVVDTVDRHRGSASIIATDHFVYFFTLPRLGYIPWTSIQGMPEYRFAAREENLLRLVEEQPAEVIIVHFPTQLGRWPFPAYQLADPTDSDEILFEDKLWPPTIVYRRRFSRQGTFSQRARQYVDLLFSQDTQTDPAIRVALVGGFPLARRLIADENSWNPLAPQTKAELLRRLREHQQTLDQQLLQENPPLRLDVRRSICARRIDEIDQDRPPQPLRWSERTLLDTWHQKICWITPPVALAGPIADEPRQGSPAKRDEP